MNDSKTSNDSGKSKHKKKVSFSIFEISTFDELAKLRKMREEELDDFVSNKKKTNQYLTNLNQRNKILSLSKNEFNSFDNKDNNQNNIINDNNTKNKNMNNNRINIPRPGKKEEISSDSYFYNQDYLGGDALKKKMALNKNRKKVIFSSDEEEDIKSNDIFSSPPQYNSIDKNEIISDNINSPILDKNKDLLSKENIFSPTSNDYNLNTNNNIPTINNMNTNIMFSENNENPEIIENENNKINEDNNNNNKNIENSNEFITFNNNKNINQENNINNILKIEENEENKIENSEKDDKEDKDDNNIINEENDPKKLENNIKILFNLLEKLFEISPINRINYIKIFFDNLFNFIEYQYDQYIDYENNDSKYYEEVEEKTKLFQQKIFYNLFLNTAKEKIEKQKIYQEHKLKAKKYAQYLNYKYKIYAFNNLLTFGIKQKEWIKSIQLVLMKRTMWNCLDSLKLYTNYKKIKNYLRMRKKKKIFDALKNNKQLSIKLLKNGRKLSLIFEYRHFFNNCRKKILAQKGKEINNKLVNEFRNQNLLRGIFNLIKKNHEIRKEKKNMYNKMIINRNSKGKDFINIKITRKETVKYNNGSTFMRIQNKLNA